MLDSVQPLVCEIQRLGALAVINSRPYKLKIAYTNIDCSIDKLQLEEHRVIQKP